MSDRLSCSRAPSSKRAKKITRPPDPDLVNAIEVVILGPKRTSKRESQRQHGNVFGVSLCYKPIRFLDAGIIPCRLAGDNRKEFKCAEEIEFSPAKLVRHHGDVLLDLEEGVLRRVEGKIA